ncbi:MAG TPA: CopG family transcriptional regulator [Cyanobacteria bacterium UBA8803]|nr:CopG family transcriptional regulator [Cyanobacteria bacterium UBA9273]HBL60799.1 CopG family transcriptional regulator [Cyanobacteria bacterium UBA8803]
MGGKTSLAGVTTYISPEWKKELEEWAQEEERSVSWILLKLIGNALQQRRQEKETIRGKEALSVAGKSKAASEQN